MIALGHRPDAGEAPCRELKTLGAYGLRPRRLARQPLGAEVGEVVGPALVVPGAERVEIVPAEDAGRMHVVEDELHRVVADRLDADDLDVALARHRLALGRAVPLHLG